MSQRLSEHAVDAQYVVQNGLEDNDRHVELFFVEKLKLVLDEYLQLLRLNRRVFVAEVGSEVDRSLQAASRDLREPFEGHLFHQLLAPIIKLKL